MKEQLATVDINDTTRHLLSNIKVAEFLGNNPDLYGDIYELIAIKATNNDDLRLIANLNVSVLKFARETRENERK